MFELVSDKDKGKIELAKTQPDSSGDANTSSDLAGDVIANVTSSVTPPEAVLPRDLPGNDSESARMITNEELPGNHGNEIAEKRPAAQPLFKAGSAGFKPFAKTPEKQGRYEQFLAMRKIGIG